MSFKDIRGHSRPIDFLKRSLENDTLSHAFIFFGPSGIGKKLVALNLAKAINCMAEKSARPCDACAPCKKIGSANHPDIFLIQPEKEGASIKIDTIRDLIKDIGLKPYEARKKAYIIDEAETMTPDAQNALLKTLEEPPSESVLVLVTENMDALLPTIVSRSQVIRFFPLAIEEVKDALVSMHEVDEARAHVLAHLSSGRIGEALRYKDAHFFEKRSKVIKGLIAKTFFDADFDGLSRKDMKLYLYIMLTWYRDILVAKSAPGAVSTLVNIDSTDAITAAAKSMAFDKVDAIIKQIIATNSFLDQNANPKLAMSTLGLLV